MRATSIATLLLVAINSVSAEAEPAQVPAIQASDQLSRDDAKNNAVTACKGQDFNQCVVATTRYIYSDRRNRGYDTDGAFTKDLDYGPKTRAITASHHKPETMCVAATSEVVIETLNFYYQATDNPRPFDIIPSDSWNGATQTDIRSYMWENEGPPDKRGAGTAFASFGAGQLVDFKDAKPGDFISLDREKFRPRVTWRPDEVGKFSQKKLVVLDGQWGVWETSGHSTVFLGYLDKSLKWTDKYPGDQTAGFLYFSSQGGHGAAGGFNYKWAIFKGAKNSKNKIVCETMPALSAPLDCRLGGIERKVRVGRLWHPSRWDANGPRQLREQVERSLVASYRPLVRKDLDALRRAVPDSQLNIRQLRDVLSGQQIFGPIAKAMVDQAVKALVDQELKKENPTFDAERFDGRTSD